MFPTMQPDIPQVSVDVVKKAVGKKEEMLLLDVRTPQEYEKARIETSINLPLDELIGKIEVVIPDKQQKIYVYCLSGSRSQVAVISMVDLGYKNVFSMNNGLLAWRAAKYPLQTA